MKSVSNRDECNCNQFIMFLVVPKNSKFRDDIFEMLLSFIGDKSLIEIDHITPYGYRVSSLIAASNPFSI